MIASHNTMTYLKPRKWWMYLLNWTAKCQSNDLITQYNKGARIFDFRIKTNTSNLNVYFAHGLIEYECSKGVVYTIVDFLNTHRSITTIRIIAEDSNSNYDYNAFNFIVNEVHKNTSVKIYIISSKKNWTIVGDNLKEDYVDYYRWSKKFFIPFPWLWYKLYGGKYKDKELSKDVYVWRDFI